MKTEKFTDNSKSYEIGRLYNGLKMTLDNDKNCIILRTRADLKNIDRALIFHLANCFIEEIECKHTELNKSNVVSLSQVTENDYSLSVNNYIEKEIVREYIDPLKLEKDVRANMLSSIRQELEISKLIYELEGSEVFGMRDFITELENVIKEYKEEVWGDRKYFRFDFYDDSSILYR